MDAKSRAAARAVELVKSGDVVGLGTGSTASRFIELLAEAQASGRLRGIRGVATSLRSEQLAHSLGIAITSLADHPVIDIAIDGADEISPEMNLIKGLGGALLREKMIAQSAKRFVVIADAMKCVPKLGTRCPVPVEVVPFEHGSHTDYFTRIGAASIIRKLQSGDALVTDNGNLIYDLHFPGGIDAPAETERLLKMRAGIVETGLFLEMCDAAIVADDTRAEIFRREDRPK